MSLHQGSATTIPLGDASVDVVVSGLVLNFVPNPRAALLEMARVTDKDATIPETYTPDIMTVQETQMLVDYHYWARDRMLEAVEQLLRAFFDRLGEKGIQRTFEYRLFDGKMSTQPFGQMLQHVVNHGSYHRGQVTTMLRQMGAAAPRAMDLIAFYRLKNASV